MEAWKILIISLLGAVAVGSVGGALIGKYLVKRARSNNPPVLSVKERIVYFVCVLVGTAFILFGVFYEPKPTNPGFTQEIEFAGNEMTGDNNIESGTIEPGIAIAKPIG